MGAIDRKGGLWIWGVGEAGQLGIPYRVMRLLSRKKDDSNEFNESRFDDAMTATSCHHPNNSITGIISFPHRLRVFCAFVHDDKRSGHKREVSRDAVRAVLRRLFAQLGLNASPEVLGHVTCRLHEEKRLVILTLTDTVLLEHSSLELSQLFGSSACHPSEVRFSKLTCGEAHSIALGTLQTKSFSVHPRRPDNSNSCHQDPLRYPTSTQLLFSWGQSKYGQLGIHLDGQHPLDLNSLLVGSLASSPRKKNSPIGKTLFHYDKYETASRNTPSLVLWELTDQTESLQNKESHNEIIELRCGGCSNLALLKGGQALVWGGNDFGVLGFPESRYNHKPGMLYQ